MNITKSAIATILCLGSLMAYDASASCSFSGNVERVYSSSNTTYVYLEPVSSLGVSYYYYFVTTDDTLAAAAHAAKADGNAYVNVTGSAASCPTSGTSRYGGTVSSITRY